MFSICMKIVKEGDLEKEISSMDKAERNFNSKIGVIQRDFYQCIQQPHIIWAATKWESEEAHNTAAENIMKVRKDDRIASAYFRPGLYFEIFCKEINDAAYNISDSEKADFIIICHGLIANNNHNKWLEELKEKKSNLPKLEGLLKIRTFYNYYSPCEFVGFIEWTNSSFYEKSRMLNGSTIEEVFYIMGKNRELASYIQYECQPLNIGGKE